QLAGKLLVIIAPPLLARKLTEDLHLFSEAACDFSTAKKHGSLNVAEALLRIQRLSPQRFSHFDKTMVTAFTGSEVESRVMMLLENNTTSKAGKFRPLLYLVLLALLSLLMV